MITKIPKHRKPSSHAFSENISNRDRKVFEENIKLHKSEAYFYEIQHPEIFNILEQRRIRNEVKKLSDTFSSKKELICLDVGSGTGNLARHLKSEFNVIACDLSRDMLLQNETEYKVVGEAGHLPIRNGICDLITSYSLVHHLPNVYKVLEEIQRVSTNSSVLYFDHDSFVKADKSNGFIEMIAYVIWLLQNPCLLKRLLEYALWGRRKHLRYVKKVDRKLTDGNPVNTAAIRRKLIIDGFKVELAVYETGSFLKAFKTGSN